MTQPSLISRITKYAKDRPYFISGGEYERLAIQAGYKGSHADRRCRDLVKAGVLEKKIERGHVWYRYIQKKTSNYEEKLRGTWCDFCGRFHSGRCEKIPQEPKKQEQLTLI